MEMFIRSFTNFVYFIFWKLQLFLNILKLLYLFIYILKSVPYRTFKKKISKNFRMVPIVLTFPENFPVPVNVTSY